MSLVALNVRMESALRQKATEAASKVGVSLSEWVRGLIVAHTSGQIENPVRVAEPVTTKASDEKPVVGRTVGATPATGVKAKVLRWCGKCARQTDDWEVRDGLAICKQCRGDK